MNINYKLKREETGLLIIDVQEKLISQVERPCEILYAIQQMIQCFKILQLPIYVTEQYPQGLGDTVVAIKSCLEPEQKYFNKTSFSCLGDPLIKQHLLASSTKQWILVGMEAHVCVLQTAKDFLAEGEQVIILNDAITSRSFYNFSTAIAELRDCGARISSVETVLFELLHDSQAAEFKQISQLIK